MTKIDSNSLRIALLFNLKHPAILDPDMPQDAFADYDTIETVQAVELALRNAGHHVILLEADHTLLDSIRHVNPDICFNMARGVDGHHRESQVPALLDMLHIPYTGSDLLTVAMSRNKVQMKYLWHAYNLPTPSSQVMRHADATLDESLDFPLFVKPVFGKLGMGLDERSIVHDLVELNRQVEWVLQQYHQPALVESYMPGREFVVGVLGNPSVAMEKRIGRSQKGSGYNTLPILEVDSTKIGSNGVFSAALRTLSPEDTDAPQFTCPAAINSALHAELTTLTIAAMEAIGAIDIVQVDFRLDAHGSPNIMSIHVLPNLDPYNGIFAQMASACDVSYDELIAEVLNLALERHCLTLWLPPNDGNSQVPVLKPNDFNLDSKNV